MPLKKTDYGVVVAGRYHPLKDKTTWLRLRKVLDDYATFQESQGSLDAEEQSAEINAVTSEVSGNTAALRISVAPERDTAPGTLAIDTLLLALVAHGGTLTYAQAPAAVRLYGWDTSASTRPDVIISNRAKRYPEWVTAQKGILTLTQEGRNRAAHVQSVLRATNAEKGG